MKRCIGIVLSLALALSCGPRKSVSIPAPVTRAFPSAEIPSMIASVPERVAWLTQHFWDRFTQTDQLYACDSLTVNGVSLEEVEKQVGTFTTMLLQVPLPTGERAMTALFGRLDAFQRAFPESNMLAQTSALISRYLFDPNSPVRSEDLYLPFVSLLAGSDLIPEEDRGQLLWDQGVCALNRMGTPAANFRFIDTAGRSRTLHSVKAEYLLLIFGNPDCHACKDLVEQMNASPELHELERSGRLQVVDIYIDQEIDLWKERMDSYPKNWINGYDPAYVIRTDRLYAVRAVPSLYLLDRDKKVLLKDAPTDRVLDALATL